MVVAFFILVTNTKNTMTCNYSMFIINTKSSDYAMAIKIFAWNECGVEVHINGN